MKDQEIPKRGAKLVLLHLQTCIHHLKVVSQIIWHFRQETTDECQDQQIQVQEVQAFIISLSCALSLEILYLINILPLKERNPKIICSMLWHAKGNSSNPKSPSAEDKKLKLGPLVRNCRRTLLTQLMDQTCK